MTGRVISKADFLTVRGVLRWAGMGVSPGIDSANSMREVLESVKDTSLAAVNALSEEIRRGVLVSQAACKAAEAVLTDVFHGQAAIDGHAHRETDHG